MAEPGNESGTDSSRDAFEQLPQIDDVFDVVFLDAEKDDYEELFRLARDKVGLVSTCTACRHPEVRALARLEG